MQLNTIRGWQFQRMELTLQTVASILSAVTLDHLSTYRDGGDGWTVVQVLGHLYDFEKVFLERAQLTVTQENPPLAFPNPDELAATNEYEQISCHEHFAAWKEVRTTHLAYLRSLDESAWERSAQHPTRGLFTLHDQLFLTTLHDCVHIEQITRILNEKRM